MSALEESMCMKKSRIFAGKSVGEHKVTQMMYKEEPVLRILVMVKKIVFDMQVCLARQ